MLIIIRARALEGARDWVRVLDPGTGWAYGMGTRLP